MRTNPAIRRIVELVADGAIGEVTHVRADFGVAGPVPARAPDARPGARRRGAARPRRLPGDVRPPVPRRARPGARAWATLTPEGIDENTGDRARLRRRRGGHPALRLRRRDRPAGHHHRHHAAGSSCRATSTARTAFTLVRDGERRGGRGAGAGQRHGVRGGGGHALPAGRADREPADPARRHPGGHAHAGHDPRPDRRLRYPRPDRADATPAVSEERRGRRSRRAPPWWPRPGRSAPRRRRCCRPRPSAPRRAASSRPRP